MSWLFLLSQDMQKEFIGLHEEDQEGARSWIKLNFLIKS